MPSLVPYKTPSNGKGQLRFNLWKPWRARVKIVEKEEFQGYFSTREEALKVEKQFKSQLDSV